MNFSKLENLLYGRNSFRYKVIPITFIVFFTALVQVVTIWGHGNHFTLQAAISNFFGDFTSWCLCLLFYAWAILWMRLSHKTHLGPKTLFGYQPKYADNGWLYFITTSITYILLHVVFPGTSVLVYEKFPKIIGVSSLLALTLCTYLLIKGKYFKEHEKDLTESAPLIYEFFRGMELHPRIFGVDVKQFTNCRIGLMSWQILLLAFFITDLAKNGLTAPPLVHLFLQTVYLLKFFWNESFYFYTLDMMLDRAGYYLCWGCLSFLPAFFCFPAAYVITHPSTLEKSVAVIMGILGIILSILQFAIDHQRYEFRAAWPKVINIRGKRAEFIVAKYTDGNGKSHTSALLTSGFWGTARHLNYFVELWVDFLISATLGFNNGLWTFGYFLFLAPLLFHRIIRDEQKCRLKYGRYWDEYKRKVPYILIPYVW